MKYTRDLLLYFIATYRTLINVVLGIILTATTIYWVAQTNSKGLDITTLENWWNAWGDPVLGLSTFLVAIVIWLSNTAMDWEDRQTKKLTVIYKYGEDEVLVCHNAYLANEGDIRNWGQTIGRQAIGQSIHFHYKIFKLEQTNKLKMHNWKYYKHYKATFFLASLPKELKNRKVVWKENTDQPEFIETNI